MLDSAKQTLLARVDALVARGATPTHLHVHPKTAADLAISGTHVDLGSERLFHSADQVAAELAHPEHDPRGARDPHPGGARHKPKTAAEAETLARPRCQKHMRRDGVVLAVDLDPAMPEGQLRVTGTQTVDAEEK